MSLKQNTSRGENEKKIECEKWSYEDGEHGPVDTIVTQVSRDKITKRTQ